MAIITDITTHLVINQTALPSYPDSSRCDEPDTTSRYVAISPNMPFSIYIHILPGFIFHSDVLLFEVFKDGHSIRQVWQGPQIAKDGRRVAIDAYIEAEELQFPHVVEDTNPNGPGDAGLWEGSEVVVQVSHAKIMKKEGEKEKEGTLDPCDSPQFEPLPGFENIQATTFKYRPLALLHHILHPPPPSLPIHPTDAVAHPADKSFHNHLHNTSSRELYCTCRQMRPWHRVITCDNDDCDVKNFHFECVGLDSRAEMRAGTWLCPGCVKLPAREVRMEGHTVELGEFREEWMTREIRDYF